MPTSTRDRLIKRRFTDKKNYPYGFARSGDFTIAESRALSERGSRMSALKEGSIAPADEKEQGYIDVIQGRWHPVTVVERAWSKYLTRIHRQKRHVSTEEAGSQGMMSRIHKPHHHSST